MDILFVCAGNTCRSVFAEYLAKRDYPDHNYDSAGFRPQSADDAKDAIDTLDWLEIDASSHQPTHVGDRDLSSYDMIVGIDKGIAGKLKMMRIDVDQLVEWDIDDPWGDDSDQYLQCARDVRKELSRLGLK